MRTVSFIVPALNEGEQVTLTVAEINAAARDLDDYQIILVDDGSVDATPEIMERLSQDDRRICVVVHESNRGLGAAYRSGLNAALMNYVMLVPGDNCFPSDSIRPILNRIGEADIIIPYHLNAGTARPWTRRLISRLFTTTANVVARRQIPYYNGIVVHRTALARDAGLETDSFAYQVELLVKLLRRGCSYATVGVMVVERRNGKTKAFSVRNLLQVFKVFLILMANGTKAHHGS